MTIKKLAVMNQSNRILLRCMSHPDKHLFKWDITWTRNTKNEFPLKLYNKFSISHYTNLDLSLNHNHSIHLIHYGMKWKHHLIFSGICIHNSRILEIIIPEWNFYSIIWFLICIFHTFTSGILTIILIIIPIGMKFQTNSIEMMIIIE